jgi:ELMO/CED-12 family
MLGLEQLVFFAATRGEVARRMLVEPASEGARYPWACAGINVTMETLRALKGGTALDEVLFRAAEKLAVDDGEGPGREAMVSVYHDIYGDLFERLHQAWVEADPENVLAFGPVFATAMREAVADLQRHGKVALGGPGSGDKSD